MDITPHTRARSRSRTRSRNSRSRSTSSTRRPLLANKKSVSSTSLSLMADEERQIPAIATTLDNTLPVDFFKQDLIGLIKALRIHKWHKHTLNPASMVLTRISGALTNSIYKIEYKDEVVLPSLLLRVYGRNVESIIDRESELAILVKLSAKRIGPRLLGIFANGRFEQFLEGFTTLGKEEIRDPVISQMLGRRMKDLHYKIELDLKDFEPAMPMSWRLIYKWLNLFETQYLQHYKEHQDLFLMGFDEFKNVIERYREWLFAHYDPRSFHQNYKFCHNDTQYGNLLLHHGFDKNHPETHKDSQLVVIDFEYSGPNFPAFDIANHFCEWMSDYYHPEKSYYIFEDRYPSRDEQLNLISAYVEYEFRHPTTKLKEKEDGTNDPFIPEACDDVEYERRKLYNEVVIWRGTVSLYWFLWGMIQKGDPTSQKDSKPAEPKVSDTETAYDIGVDSTYLISQMENTHLDDVVVEDAITSSDDDFDYLKYSQQKMLMFVGDLIGLGVMGIEEVAEKYRESVKRVDVEMYRESPQRTK